MGMKYRDPNTGQLKELSLKAADTLPVGTIVDYDGETVPDGWEKYGTEDYSTEETFTGKHWIDGKPIYRKTIVVTNDSNLTQIKVQHNIQNLNEVTDVRGSIKTYTSWKPITNMYVPNVAEYGVAIYNISAEEKNFQILVGATLAREKAFIKAYVTLEYTKTTD